MFGFFDTTFSSPNDEGVSARQTVRVVPPVTDDSSLTAAPEFNGRYTDDAGSRQGGIVRRDVGGHVTGRVQYPIFWNEEKGRGSRENDERQATLGVYAAREEAGQGGHGPLMIVQSLEPTIRSEAVLGGVTQMAEERPTHDTQTVSAIPQNDGRNVALAQAATGFGSVNSSLAGLW